MFQHHCNSKKHWSQPECPSRGELLRALRPNLCKKYLDAVKGVRQDRKKLGKTPDKWNEEIEVTIIGLRAPRSSQQSPHLPLWG